MNRYELFIKMNRMVPRVVTGISIAMMLAFAVSLSILG